MERHKPALSQELNSHIQHTCSSELMHLNGSGLQPTGHTNEADRTWWSILVCAPKSKVLVILSSIHGTEHLLTPTNYSFLFALVAPNCISISPAKGSTTAATTPIYLIPMSCSPILFAFTQLHQLNSLIILSCFICPYPQLFHLSYAARQGVSLFQFFSLSDNYSFSEHCSR